MVNETQINSFLAQIMSSANNAYLVALKKAFRDYNVPDRWYGILEEKEDAVCLTNSGTCWEISRIEKGKKEILGQYDDIEDACLIMLNKIADDETEYKEMKKIYNNYVSKVNSVHKVYSMNRAKESLKQFISTLETY